MDTEVTGHRLGVQQSNLDRSNDFSFRFHTDTGFGIYPASTLMELFFSRSKLPVQEHNNPPTTTIVVQNPFGYYSHSPALPL
jgi:hypothetical protein